MGTVIKYNGAILFAVHLLPGHPRYKPWAIPVAKSLGINTFRIRKTHEVNPSQLRTVIDILHQQGMFALPVLPFWSVLTTHNINIPDLVKAKQKTYNYIVGSGLVNHPAVHMWDIINEPMDIDRPDVTTWLTEMLEYTRSLDSSKPVSFGGWHSLAHGWNSPLDVPLFVDLVDWLLPHYFIGLGAKTYEKHKTFLNAVKSQSKGKPVHLNAWGYGTSDDALQESYYRATLQAISDVNIEGSQFWCLLPQFPTEPASIAYYDGRLRPAANTVKAFFLESPPRSSGP